MIPITKPFLSEEEVAAAREVILSGWVTQGPKVKQFEQDFSKYVNSKHACAVSSCTAALHIALLTVGVKPGDVVITVSHSFIATANSIRHCGAEPIFIDIEPNTYNISPENLEKCLTKDCELINGELFFKNIKDLTRGESPLKYLFENFQSNKIKKLGRVAAIMPVHQMGMPCDIKKIVSLSKKFNLPVIEDAACAIGSEIKLNETNWEKIGKPHGDIACFSFHPRKIITTGDGGMMTTNNPIYDKKFRLLRHQGMSISDLDRHNTKNISFEKYLTTGFNYRMTDIQAAIGIEQIKKLPTILKKRKKIADIYSTKLNKLSWIKAAETNDYSKTNWQSYPAYLTDKTPLNQKKLIQYLLNNSVTAKRGIMNAHQEDAYLNNNHKLPNSEIARDNVILLPIFSEMTDEDLKYCISQLESTK